MHLEAVGAVLELVGRLDRLPRQLARLAGRHEAAAEPVGEGAAEDEAARLGAEDHVGLERPRERLEPVDRLPEVDGVGDERHQVLEDDPRLGEVRDVADAVAQVERGPGVLTGGPYLSARSRSSRQKRSRESSCEVSASAWRSSRPDFPPLRVAGAQRRSDELLEQAGLAPGGVAEGAQVAGVDAVLREPAAGGRDVDVALAVEALAALDPRRQQPVLLERAREVGVDAGALAELREVELAPPARRARADAAACARPRRARRELLPDHAERQELVALQPQDRLQPLDVLLAEEPVAAARALRRQQALILEVADLRDRDVRELGLQPRADRADRVQPRLLGAARCGRRGVVVLIGAGRSGGTCRSGARRRPRARPTRSASGSRRCR